MRDWITLLGLSLLGFAIGQDLTSVCVSLTKIQAHAAESSVMALWVVYIYLLTIAVMLPVFDQYSKILPQRKMFLYGGLAFTVGEFFITRSTNSWLLLTARVIQGVGTACLLPAIWSWVLDYFASNSLQRLRPFILMTTLGLGVGPLIAAAGMYAAGAAQIDTIMLLIALLGTLLTLVNEPKTKPPHICDINRFIPVCYGLMLVFLLLPIVESVAWGWISIQSLVCYSIAALAGACFIYSELRTASPIYQLRVSLHRNLISRSILCFVMGWVITTLLVAVPMYATTIMEELPFVVGIAMLCLTFTQFLTFYYLREIEQDIDQITRYMICFGGFAITAFMLSFVSADSSIIFVGMSLIPAGFAWGMSTQIITETNNSQANENTTISPDSNTLINAVIVGALMGTALSFTFFKWFQKAFALDKISDGKILLPVDLSGSTTGLVQTIFDMGNIEKLGQHIPYRTLEKLVPILRQAGTFGIQHLAWLLIIISMIGFFASYLTQRHFAESQ